MVAGGSNDGLLDSVEFLDLENDHLWTMGKISLKIKMSKIWCEINR